MRFKYKGINKEGKKVKGSLLATNEAEAKSILKRDGIYFYELKPLQESRALKALLSKKMSASSLNDFSRELSSYISSGMSLLTAFKLMENQHANEKQYRAFLEGVRKRIEEGAPLYKALSAQEVYQLPDFFLQSIKVSSKSGKVSEVLKSMGQFFSLQSRLRKQVLSALTYPLFIFIVAMSMTGFLITFVVPKITGIFQDTHQELPPVTKFVLSLSDFFSNHYIAIFVSIFLSIALFQLLYRFIEPFGFLIDRTLLKLPIFGSLIQNHELARFAYILSLMLNSGVSYAQAIILASSTFSNRALKSKFKEASIKVEEGNRLSNALQMVGGVKLKRNFLQSLALGEDSSEVSSVMFNLSKLYSEENEDRIKMLLSLLEPIMMLLIGAIVGVIVMAMLLPIFSMSLGAKI